MKLYEKIRTEDAALPDLPDGRAPSSALCSLLRAMLEKAPERRLSLIDVARHAWTTEVGPGRPGGSCSRPRR